MATLVVPKFDPESPWPTLGPSVCDFIEERMIFGPGSLEGEPAVLDDDKRLQASDNIVPLVASSLSTGVAASALNAVTAKLDQATLDALNKAVIIDHGTSEEVAQQFIAQNLS